MSSSDIESGNIVIASAGMILYRYTKGGTLQVLVGERRSDPWDKCTMLVFGGLVKIDDKNVFSAALREAEEETGGDLVIKPHGIRLGTFGPRSFHHLLSLDKNKRIRAVKTDIPIASRHYFTMTVYAGQVLSGRPHDTGEVKTMRFEDPHKLAYRGATCAFEQAYILQKFCKRFIYNYQDAS